MDHPSSRVSFRIGERIVLSFSLDFLEAWVERTLLKIGTFSNKKWSIISVLSLSIYHLLCNNQLIQDRSHVLSNKNWLYFLNHNNRCRVFHLIWKLWNTEQWIMVFHLKQKNKKLVCHFFAKYSMWLYVNKFETHRLS